MNGLPEGGLVLATVHEYGLGAEHFGHFGENGSSTLRHEPVGEDSEKRVRGDAGKAVRSPTLQTHAEFAHGDILTDVILASCINLAQALQAVFDFILNLLAGEHLHAFLINGADEFTEGVQLVVLATETHDQHSARIRMVHHIGENLAGVFVVAAQL